MGNIIVGGIVAALVIGAVGKLVYNKKKGVTSCGCGCSTCASGCDNKK